jgi:hypothetical protein
MIVAPLRLAFSSAVSMRGWLVPGFWPTTRIRSACGCRRGDRALADADRLGQRRPARLVAHVRAVGQVVRAEGAHEQLVEERRLVARAARRCRRPPRRATPARAARRRSARTRRPTRSARSASPPGAAHRLGEAALLAEPVVGRSARARRRVGGEELGVDARARGLLGDAFAPFSQNSAWAALSGLGPRAARGSRSRRAC